MPFIDTAELADVLREAYSTVHRALTGLLDDGIVGRVSHGTAQLPSSHRYYLTTQGIGEAAGVLHFATPSDFVRAYPLSREWFTLLIRRMDSVASVYRLASSLSPGVDGLRSHVDFHRRGRFDAAITLHDGRTFGVVRQGLALRRRSLYDRLRAIAEYRYPRRPEATLILTPSIWEQRSTARFCIDLNLSDCYIAVESRDALEGWNLRLWCQPSWVFGSTYHTLETVKFSRQLQRRPPHGAAKPEAVIDTQSCAYGADCAHLRHQPIGEADIGPYHRPPDAPPRASGPLARRLGGTGQPDDAQSSQYMGPG